jgi:hypothetical protein
MPGGYYTFLRLAVALTCIIIIANDVKAMHAVWLVLFVNIAVLFNPVIPVYFYKKSLWTPINVIAAMVFVGYASYYRRNKNI